MTEIQPVPAMLQDYKFNESTFFSHLYYTDNDSGPCCGWQHAILHISKNGRVQVFCPFTGTSFSVKSQHPLIVTAQAPKATVDRMQEYLKSKWIDKLDKAPAFIGAILEFPNLQHLQNLQNNESANIEFRLIKRNSKRGKFLNYILEQDSTVQIKNLVKVFGITRNNVLSYLYQMKKVNGIEYILNKAQDTVTVIPPLNEIWEG